MKLQDPEFNKCEHAYPEPYGASQVIWHDRENGYGTVIVPCQDCGDVFTWAVSA